MSDKESSPLNYLSTSLLLLSYMPHRSKYKLELDNILKIFHFTQDITTLLPLHIKYITFILTMYNMKVSNDL